METKICTKCNGEKTIDNFSKKYKTKEGIQRYQPKCKVCINEEMILYRSNEEYKLNRCEYDKLYYEENKEKILNYKKEYLQKNIQKILSVKRIYVRNHKYKSAWYRILHRTLKCFGNQKQEHTIDLLGYSAIDLKNHLESLFTEGMSWDNYGEWEIDHIKPVSKFRKDSHPSEVNSLSNLQPLWKEKNRAKHNHYSE